MATTHEHGGVRRLLLQVKKMWQLWVWRHTRDHHLPNDVIFEILLRLPAKSLLRFKWVCKYWFDLITSDDEFFIKMHHLHGSTSSHDNEILSIISTSERSISCWDVDYSDNSGTCGYHVSSELNTSLGFEHPKILGSCNGLVLLSEYRRKKLCILNPCTKEYRILPSSVNDVDRPLVVENYGFGYDHTNNDYKVLRKAYYLVGNKQYFEVYTLGTNSWRMTERFEHKWTSTLMAETVFLNGFLYWIDYLQCHVHSFDIEKEQQFHNMPKIPNIVDGCIDIKLEVFEGCLCAVVRIKDQQVYRVEMWVMKDYIVNNNNKKNLWTKLLTIPDLQYSQFPIKPLRYTRNGEILVLSNHSHLFWCNPKNNDRNNPLNSHVFWCNPQNNDINNLARICRGHDFVKEVYTESLVSLNSGTYTGQERKNNNKKMWIAT